LETKLRDNHFWIEIKMVIKKAYLKKGKLSSGKNEKDLANLVKQLVINDLYDEKFIGSIDPYARNKKMNKSSSLSRYIESIILNGTDPSRRFSQALYKEINEDIKSSGVPSILHYLEFGIKEERMYAKSESNFQETLHACRCKSIDLTAYSKFLIIDIQNYYEISAVQSNIKLMLDCLEFKNYHKIIKINDKKFKLSDSEDITFYLTCGTEVHTINQKELITNDIEEIVYIDGEVIRTKENTSNLLSAVKNRVIYDQNFINFWPEITDSKERIIGYKLFRKSFIVPNISSENTFNFLFFADIPNSSAIVSNQRVFNQILIKKLFSYEIDWAWIGIKAKESQIRFVTTKESKAFSSSKLLAYNEAKYFRTREKTNKEFSFELEKYPRVITYSPEYLKMNGNVSQVNLGASQKTIDLLNYFNMIPMLNLINILVWRLEDNQDYDVVLLSEDDLRNPKLNVKDKNKVVFLDTKNYSLNANSFDIEFMINPIFDQYYDTGHFYRYNLKLISDSNNLNKLYYSLNIVFANRNLKVLDSFIDPSFST
jgi:hypothetical protein